MDAILESLILPYTKWSTSDALRVINSALSTVGDGPEPKNFWIIKRCREILLAADEMGSSVGAGDFAFYTGLELGQLRESKSGMLREALTRTEASRILRGKLRKRDGNSEYAKALKAYDPEKSCRQNYRRAISEKILTLKGDKKEPPSFAAYKKGVDREMDKQRSKGHSR